MTQRVTVEGMSCEGCERTVEEALAEVDGVESAEADHETDTATVHGDANGDDLVNAVHDAGYEASSGMQQ